MADQTHLTMIVQGRVQGVYFRAFVQKEAQSLGLSGFVRNLPDFTKVEIQAEGYREKLEILIKQAWAGPPGANVEKIETSWSQYQGAFKSFEIRY